MTGRTTKHDSGSVSCDFVQMVSGSRHPFHWTLLTSQEATFWSGSTCSDLLLNRMKGLTAKGTPPEIILGYGTNRDIFDVAFVVNLDSKAILPGSIVEKNLATSVWPTTSVSLRDLNTDGTALMIPTRVPALAGTEIIEIERMAVSRDSGMTWTWKEPPPPDTSPAIRAYHATGDRPPASVRYSLYGRYGSSGCRTVIQLLRNQRWRTLVNREIECNAMWQEARSKHLARSFEEHNPKAFGLVQEVQGIYRYYTLPFLFEEEFYSIFLIVDSKGDVVEIRNERDILERIRDRVPAKESKERRRFGERLRIEAISQDDEAITYKMRMSGDVFFRLVEEKGALRCIDSDVCKELELDQIMPAPPPQ